MEKSTLGGGAQGLQLYVQTERKQSDRSGDTYRFLESGISTFITLLEKEKSCRFIFNFQL